MALETHEEREEAPEELRVSYDRVAKVFGARLSFYRLESALGDRGLVELTASVALANDTNRFNVALAIDLP